MRTRGLGKRAHSLPWDRDEYQWVTNRGIWPVKNQISQSRVTKNPCSSPADIRHDPMRDCIFIGFALTQVPLLLLVLGVSSGIKRRERRDGRRGGKALNWNIVS